MRACGDGGGGADWDWGGNAAVRKARAAARRFHRAMSDSESKGARPTVMQQPVSSMVVGEVIWGWCGHMAEFIGSLSRGGVSRSE